MGRVRRLFVAIVLFSPYLVADQRIEVDLSESEGVGNIAPIGDAEIFDDPDGPYADLTSATPNSLGALWIEESFDALNGSLTVHFEYSVELPDGLPKEGETGGGMQLVLELGHSGHPFNSLAVGGDSLGTGGAGIGPYLGVAIDLGTDPPFGPFGPHIEINQNRDPAADGTVASTRDAPDVLGTGSAGARVRYTITLDAETISVYASSDHDCFGGRTILTHRYAAPEPRLLENVAVGFFGASTDTPVVHRLHRVRIVTHDAQPQFLRGDCNQDGIVCGSVTDMIAIVNRCFQGGPELPCEDACDANDDGTVCGGVTDVIFLANYCFLGSGVPPSSPIGECGVDPTEDALPCLSPDACGSGAPSSDFIYLGVNDRGFDEHLRLRDDMVMVEIPAGSFEQGDHFLDYGGDELPVHTTTLSRPFLFGKFEITVAQYRRFLEAIGCDEPGCTDYDHRWDFDGHEIELYDGSHYPGGDIGSAWARNVSYFERAEFDEFPVIWIDWFDAVAYSRWANGVTSRDWSNPLSFGIPTEAEWEYAASYRGEGKMPTRYPWGGSEGLLDDPENIDETRCNFGQHVGRTVAVCSYPAGRSHFGVYNQSGNVYEWTADWYDGDSYETAPERDPFVDAGARCRQLRGGGWFGPPFSQRGAYRCNFEADHPDTDVGIRCSAPVPR
jgi:formylglycine-generating enzyme required for sulfatase activity